MLRAKLFILFAILIFASGKELWAKQIHNYRWHYSLEILSNWLPESGDDSSRVQVFRSPDERLFVEIEAWERREVENLRDIYLKHLSDLGGEGIVTRFPHLSYDVLLARVDYHRDKPWPQLNGAEEQLPTTDLELEGRLDFALEQNDSAADPDNSELEKNTTAYVFYFYGAQYAYRVASITPRNASELEKDIQYSILDSFGFEGHNSWNRGPITNFFIQEKTDQELEGKSEKYSLLEFEDWRLGDFSFRALRNPIEDEVAQTILEREKRILLATPEDLFPYALARFYRLMFRLSHMALKDFAVSLEKKYKQLATVVLEKDEPILPIYEYLIYDLQDMLLSSGRGTEPSREVALELPSKFLREGAGNIETLALVYLILNSHFQHNTLILYSPKYSQLLIGVEELQFDEENLLQRYEEGFNVKSFEKYNGITIVWYRNRYLMGELTAPIYIGWARTPLRDLIYWIPMAFSSYRTPNFFP